MKGRWYALMTLTANTAQRRLSPRLAYRFRVYSARSRPLLAHLCGLSDALNWGLGAMALFNHQVGGRARDAGPDQVRGALVVRTLARSDRPAVEHPEVPVVAGLEAARAWLHHVVPQLVAAVNAPM